MLCHLFIHITSLSFFQRVFTDADLYDHKILRRRPEVLTVLDEFITEHELTLPENLPVIDLYKEEEIHATYYQSSSALHFLRGRFFI